RLRLLVQNHVKFLGRSPITCINASGLLQLARRFIQLTFLDQLAAILEVEQAGIGASNSLMENIQGVGRVSLLRLLIVHQCRVPILPLLRLAALVVSEVGTPSAA